MPSIETRIEVWSSSGDWIALRSLLLILLNRNSPKSLFVIEKFLLVFVAVNSLKFAIVEGLSDKFFYFLFWANVRYLRAVWIRRFARDCRASFTSTMHSVGLNFDLQPWLLPKKASLFLSAIESTFFDSSKFKLVLALFPLRWLNKAFIRLRRKSG